MTELRCRMMADMKLHGLAPGTQQVYLKSVECLARHFHRSPDQLSEQDLRAYFTFLAEKKRVGSSTLRTAIFGVKFLFDKTLQRPWPTLKFLRARPSYKCCSRRWQSCDSLLRSDTNCGRRGETTATRSPNARLQAVVEEVKQ